MMMGLLGTFGLNGMLALGAYWSARHGFRQPAGLTRTLAAVTLAWTWATVGLEILGVAGALGLPALLAWSTLGLGIGLVLRARDRQPDQVEGFDPPGQPWAWESVAAPGLDDLGGPVSRGPIAALAGQGRQRRADLSPLLRGPMVEGGAALA